MVIQTLQRVDGLFISFSFFREKLHDLYSRHFSVFPACRDFSLMRLPVVRPVFILDVLTTRRMIRLNGSSVSSINRANDP